MSNRLHKSFDYILKDKIAVRNPTTTGAVDEYGLPDESQVQTTVYRALVTIRSSDEVRGDRNTHKYTMVAVTDLEAVIDEQAEIKWNNKVWNIETVQDVAPPFDRGYHSHKRIVMYRDG